MQSASTSRTWIAPVWLRELAERQWGAVARRQLREGGIGGATTARAIARGWLVRVHPGVYALGHAALAIEGRLMAAVLYAGPGAVLSHTTAGWCGSSSPPTRRSSTSTAATGDERAPVCASTCRGE